MKELNQTDVLTISGGRPDSFDYESILAEIGQEEHVQSYLTEMLQLSQSIRAEFAW